MCSMRRALRTLPIPVSHPPLDTPLHLHAILHARTLVQTALPNNMTHSTLTVQHHNHPDPVEQRRISRKTRQVRQKRGSFKSQTCRGPQSWAASRLALAAAGAAGFLKTFCKRHLPAPQSPLTLGAIIDHHGSHTRQTLPNRPGHPARPAPFARAADRSPLRRAAALPLPPESGQRTRARVPILPRARCGSRPRSQPRPLQPRHLSCGFHHRNALRVRSEPAGLRRADVSDRHSYSGGRRP